MDKYFIRATLKPNEDERANGMQLPDGAFTFSAIISDDTVDTYFTRMDESTLQNYAEDARRGVMLLDSHDYAKLGYGQSFNGDVVIVGDKQQVRADFYTVPNIKFGGKMTYASTDDFIAAVQAGLVRDVSVGFFGGEVVCDICGEPVYGYNTNCPHILGVEYDVDGQRRIATGTIKNARLAEVSVVAKGANENAELVERKLLAMQARGQALAEPVIEMVRAMYSLKNDNAGKPEKTENGGIMEKLSEKAVRIIAGNGFDDVTAESVSTVLEAQAEMVERLKGDIELAQEKTDEQNRKVAELKNAVEELKPLAQDGEKYREFVISDALSAGVKALGNGFPKEVYEQAFARMTVDEIRKVGESFAAVKFAPTNAIEDEEGGTDDRSNEKKGVKHPQTFKV